MDKPTLIFIHIPKTAGTAAGMVIDRQFSRRVTWRIKRVVTNQRIAEFKSLPEVKRQMYRYMKGHIPYGMHAWTGRPTTYITLLRDPVEHVASAYYYSRRRPSMPSYKILNEKQISLTNFAQGHLMDEWANLQTRLLCGSAIPDALDKDKPVTPAMLEAAKENIRRDFSCVGLTERFDESILLMQRVFGWKNISYAKRRVTQERPRGSEIPTDVVDLLRKRTQLDAELYEFACGVFEAQLAAVGGISAKDVEAFRRRNRAFAVLWPMFDTPRQRLIKKGRHIRDRYFPQLKRH